MQNEWKPADLYKCPDLLERHKRFVSQVAKMTAQEVTERYTQEMLKLKTWNRFEHSSERFLGYPNTLRMNQCRLELERRGLPVPQVHLPEEQEKDHDG